MKELLASPDLLPMRINIARREVSFIRMSRESYMQSAFLDRRAVRAAPGEIILRLDDLLQQVPRSPSPHSLHVILHGAFCGSTLLARYLEELPQCMVLKEPGALGQMTDLFSRRGIDGADWSNLFELTMTLLHRTYPGQVAVIVKAPDYCNWMGERMLARDPRAKIAFLASPLRTFLLQALKIDHRRQWLKEHLQALRPFVDRVPFLGALDPLEWSDGQRAAAMWLLNGHLCASLLERFGRQRVLLVSGEELIREPSPVVQSVADFFDVIENGMQRTMLANLRPLARHAKDARLAYDVNTRLAELEDAERRFGPEIDAAMAWAREVGAEWLSNCPFPLT